MSLVPKSDSMKIPKSEMDAPDLELDSGTNPESEIATCSSDPIDSCLSSDLPFDEIKYTSFRDDPDVTGEVWDPIFRSSYFCNLNGLVSALDAGSDLEYRTILSYTSLHMAAKKNFCEGISLLLKRGADINAVTNNKTHPHLKHTNCTALMLAAARGHIDTVKLLLDNGANYNLADDNGFTVLHTAVYKSRDKIVEILVNLPNIDLNAISNLGFTSIQLAAFRRAKDEQLTNVIERTINLVKIDNVVKILKNL